MVPQPSALGSCESAGGSADGAISFKMALSVVMSKRRIEEGLEVLCDIFICFEECCYQLLLTCQVCLASVFFCSAIIEHTNRVIFLEDDDIAAVTDGKLSIHRLKRSASDDPSRAIQTLQMELQQIMKGRLKHL